MKKCFKCEIEKPISEFYKHKQMADGHLNKCKGCTKSDSTNNRNKNIETVRAYDRRRGARQSSEYLRDYRAKYPQKYKAQMMVANAIREGKLFKKPCSNCQSEDNIHAHHNDYLEPLNIHWLCSQCHSQWHRDNGEGLNGDYK